MDRQKFSLVIAVAAALIGVASANKLALEEELLEPGLHHHHGIGGLGGGGFRGGGLGHIEDELLFEELRRRGHHGGFGGFGSRFGGLGPGGFGRNRFGRRKPLIGGGAAGLGGVGAGAAAGAEGAVSNLDSVSGASHLGTHNLAEGAQGTLLGTKNDFDVGNHVSVINDVGGTHKHNVINSKKLLVSDTTTGVNDEDSFHKTNGFSKGTHIGGSKSKIAAQASGGRVESDFDKDHEIDLTHANAAEAAVGGAAAEGALGGGGAGIF